MSSEFTFGDNSDDSIFRFFLNLADRDLTENQITQTLTLSDCAHVWSGPGESDCSLHTQRVDLTNKGNPTV